MEDPSDQEMAIDDSLAERYPLVVESLDEVPDFTGIPANAQKVLAMTLSGMSTSHIAGAIGTNARNVNKMIRRYDPDRRITLSKHLRRQILAKVAEGIGQSAMLNITPEKLEHASAKECMDVARKATQIAEDLDPSGHRVKPVESNLSDFLKRLAE